MEYQVEMSDEADAELDAAFRWYIGARAAINSLSELPRRCPLARENASYPDNEVRQLLYGTGCSAYHILFMVFDDDAEVRVVQLPSWGATAKTAGPKRR